MKKTLDILAALDSFKGSLSSLEAGEAVRRGVHSRFPDAEVTVFAVGDGGEGTAEALCQSLHAEMHEIPVHDTHMSMISASFGTVEIGGVKTAIFDMAAASGIRFAKEHGLDIMNSTTYGVGEMIRYAVSLGCGEIIVGLGGSGTSDGGMGALTALGAVFTDENGATLDGITSSLGRVRSCDLSPAVRLLSGVKLTLLYDAAVALTGETGAVRMFSRQKGASEEMLPALENAMASYASVCDNYASDAVSMRPGAGAAGGLGYGLSLIGGLLTPGADFVLDTIGFSEAARTADLIITGEGKTDAQTETGKLPMTVAKHSCGKPVVCLCGKNEAGPGLYACGIDAVFAIADGPISLEESVERTGELVEKSAYNLVGLALKFQRDS
ncbi:MAG: glycerate kinase [Clostridia bacterium]|nr:glycerate kinase [Clostridia bacterium]MBQ8512996.1 glycerate kinase [Clostridia bacterium]